MKVIEKKSFLVVGLKVSLKEHQLFVKMPKVYDQFYQMIDEINDRVNAYSIDISLKREKEIYTQLVCVEVSQLNNIPDCLIGMEIPNAKYLYYLHNGNVEGIYQAFVDMYDFALNEKLPLDKDEFKIEIHDKENDAYHLYIRLEK